MRLAAIACAAMLWAAPAAAELRPVYGGSLRGSLPSEPASLEPSAAQSQAELTLVSLLFDTLYRFEGERVVPHLAATLPEPVPGTHDVRIALRPGARFSDGTPLRAADVLESLQRSLRRPTWLLAPVAALEVEGEALLVHLHRPTPELAMLLSAPATAITSSHRGSSAAPLGSGPFVLERLDRANRRLVLLANELHFAGRPYLDRIELAWFVGADEEARRYEIGGAEFSLAGDVAFVGHQPKYPTTTVDGPATALVYLGVGGRHSALQTSRWFRRALSLGVARNVVASGALLLPTVHVAPAALGGAGATARALKADVSAARAALRRARAEAPVLGDSSLILELVIDRTRNGDQVVAERVQAALYRLGLRSVIIAVDAVQWQARAARADLFIGELAASVATPALLTAAALAAAGDPVAARSLRRGELDGDVLAAELARRQPLIVLLHRALRVHHVTALGGLFFDRRARLRLADVFLIGERDS